jgi:hypothetical protein
MSPQTEAVVTHANQLAAQGREDDQAVAELRTLARGKRRVLKSALRASYQGGLHREQVQVNRAYRLILAAQDGSVVPPVADDDRERIAEVEGLMALSRDERWARLVQGEPRLTGALAAMASSQVGCSGVTGDRLVGEVARGSGLGADRGGVTRQGVPPPRPRLPARWVR